jgi:hypothetical protein
MLKSFWTSPWVLVAAIAVVGLVTLPRGFTRSIPFGRATVGALAAAAVAGTVANDSGIAVGGAVLVIGWPVVASYVQQHRGPSREIEVQPA